MTKLKLNDNNIKHDVFYCLRSFLNQFGCGVKIKPNINPIYSNKWIGLVVMTPKTYANYRQTNQQAERVHRKH